MGWFKTVLKSLYNIHLEATSKSIHSFRKYLRGIYYVVGIVLGVCSWFSIKIVHNSGKGLPSRASLFWK